MRRNYVVSYLQELTRLGVTRHNTVIFFIVYAPAYLDLNKTKHALQCIWALIKVQVPLGHNFVNKLP